MCHAVPVLQQRLKMTGDGLERATAELAARGLVVERRRGGLCLPEPLDLLDADRIFAQLGAAGRSRCTGISVLPRVDSTNSWVLDRAREGKLAEGAACFAEHQSAGRGRRGREWVAAYGGSICLSVYSVEEVHGPALSGLAPAMGVATVQAVESLGVTDVKLKWPNDVLWGGGKLAGILVESSAPPGDAVRVVVGVGLNVRLGRDAGARIDQPWTDLNRALGHRCSRDRVAARLLDALLDGLRRFRADGFQAFAKAWMQRDACVGRAVGLSGPDGGREGVARGVDQDGALLLETTGGVIRVHSGELSMRAGAPGGGT